MASEPKPAVPTPSPHVPDDVLAFRLVAAWRWPRSAAKQRAFLAKHKTARLVYNRPTWSGPGDLSLTTEESNRLRMIRRAEWLEETAQREARRAPALANPIPVILADGKRPPTDAGSKTSVEWRGANVYAPQVLALAKRARRLLLAERWAEAEPVVLQAELALKEANIELRHLYEDSLWGQLAKYRGRKKGSYSALRLVLNEIHDDVPRRSWPQVYDRLIKLAAEGHKTIQEVADGVVYWNAASGREKKTTELQVRNQFYAIRRQAARRPQRSGEIS